MNEELKKILGSNLIINAKTIPVAHLKYKGNSKTYITWVIINETSSLSANDIDLYGVCSVDIDIFSDGNYLEIVKEIKKIMKSNEWIWIEDSTEMYEEDTELYHKTCTFEKEEEI